MNKYKGEYDIKIQGEVYKVTFTWNALSKIFSKYDEKILDNIAGSKPEILADILAIGLQENHPDVTADWVIKSRVPFIPSIQAIQGALMYGLYGDEVPEEVTQEANEVQGKGKSKKKA